jgi:hypothetical protein
MADTNAATCHLITIIEKTKTGSKTFASLPAETKTIEH